jgi:FixJ family two-component response regulator
MMEPSADAGSSETDDPIVFVVDDNSAVCDAIGWLVEEVGLQAKTFTSAQEFLAFYRPEMRGCLVLDVRMPEMSGLDLQEKLIEAKCRIPVIFITGHGDIPVTVRAMKAGAFDFLQKPFSDQALLDDIFAAIQRDLRLCSQDKRRATAELALSVLTRRERDILRLLRDGKSSKVIAADLNISVRTVEGHRAQIMRKMKVHNIGQLVEFVLRAESDEKP